MKAFKEQIAGGVSIISAISQKPGNISVGLVEKIRQSSCVPDVVLGQIRTNDLMAYKVQP